ERTLRVSSVVLISIMRHGAAGVGDGGDAVVGVVCVGRVSGVVAPVTLFGPVRSGKASVAVENGEGVLKGRTGIIARELPAAEDLVALVKAVHHRRINRRGLPYKGFGLICPAEYIRINFLLSPSISH